VNSIRLIVASAACPLLALALTIQSEALEISTFAGLGGSYGSTDGPGTGARFKWPTGIAVDSSGNAYVADANNHTIRKITADGVVTTLAGQADISGSADGDGTEARFNTPRSTAVDAAGNVYVADEGNHTIRRISPTGEVSTLAGLAGSSGIVDGLGAAARFKTPRGVAVDKVGNVFVADQGNATIRKITADGTVSTLAGRPGTTGLADGTGINARFTYPEGLAVDGAGNVYVGDWGNETVRKIAPDGVVSTLAGGREGSADGTGRNAQFHDPTGVAVDSAGNVFVTDTLNHTVRKITPASVVSTFVGTAGFYGSADATGAEARFYYPRAVALTPDGAVLVADSNNNTIRKITPEAVVSTLAGLAGGSADGVGHNARFFAPWGLAVDQGGNVFVADTENHTIRKIIPDRVVSTLAGLATVPGAADGQGATARFSSPRGVAVDAQGFVYVADTQNHAIRRISLDGRVSTFAGLAGSRGYADGGGSAARFSGPQGIAVDSAGNLYVSDSANYTIRKISPNAVVTTLAGLAGSSGTTDGVGNAARFNYPAGIAVDSAGNLYVAEEFRFTLRKITPDGTVSILAGLAGASGSTDGTGETARFSYPFGVAVDRAHNLYVADDFHRTIRMVTPSGTVTTIAGLARVLGSTDGFGSDARFFNPRGVAVYPSRQPLHRGYRQQRDSCRKAHLSNSASRPNRTPSQAGGRVLASLSYWLRAGSERLDHSGNCMGWCHRGGDQGRRSVGLHQRGGRALKVLPSAPPVIWPDRTDLKLRPGTSPGGH
jgi:sugar lactone lactonase YvrE